MEPAQRSRWLRARLLAVAVLAAALLGAAGMPLLPALLPLQSGLVRALLPEFDVAPLSLSKVGGTLRLALSARSREHLVLQGRVFAPGLDVDVHTPARQTQRQAALALASAGLVGVLSRRRRPWRMAAMLAAGALLTAAAAPLVLAGQLWALVVEPLAEPTLRALLAAASRLLLHGGDMAAMLLLTMVLSDHARPWFGRTIRAPAGEEAGLVARKPA